MTDRDREILEFTARYKLATGQAIHRTFFEGLTTKASERVTQRLCRSGLLAPYPLWGKVSYYTLTLHGARTLGLPERRAGTSFGPQAMVTHYGILEYCTGRMPHQPRLTEEEFRAHFPELARARGVTRSRYYLEHDRERDKLRLSLLSCDCACHPRRLLRKVRREFARRRAMAAWRPLVDGGLFSVTLLVATGAKAGRVRSELASESLDCRVEVVPELLRVLPEVRHGRTTTEE